MGWGGKPTINDVAREAGVSNATVSYVLSGKGSVGKDTRERILKVVEELGYQPDRIARTMKVGWTNIIGLIVPNLSDPLYVNIVEDVERACREVEKCVFLMSIDNELSNLNKHIKRFVEHRVGGIIFCHKRQISADSIDPTGIPTVVFRGKPSELAAKASKRNHASTTHLAAQALDVISTSKRDLASSLTFLDL